MAYFDQQWQQKRQQQPIGPSPEMQNQLTPGGGMQMNDQGEAVSSGEQEQQPQGPAWDRTAFRDAWMSSGIQNVPDMQNWLNQTGWGQHVRTAGSKGDVMQLPGGENIDAVLAAGLGGNRGGPQWTGKGNWQSGEPQGGWGAGQGAQQGIGPSMGMMGGMQQMQQPMSRTQQMQGMGQQQSAMKARPQGMRRQGLAPTQSRAYETRPLVK